LAQKKASTKRPFRPRLFTWNLVGSGLLTCSAHSQWHSLFPVCIWSRGDPAIGLKTPRRGHSDQVFGGVTWSVRVWLGVQRIPNGILCFQFAFCPVGRSHWLKNPPEDGIPTKVLDVELSRFGAADVFSAFPMAFSVSNLHLVPGDPAIGSNPPPKRAFRPRLWTWNLVGTGLLT